MSAHEPGIHLAFRFHVNFYHSYRGDSLDEKGIGKDIRILRSILDDLDALEAEGIPVRCAWDIENYFSLETYLPRHAPDILERIRTRVEKRLDEVELMSWNNGLLSTHTKEEFSAAMSRAITNSAGSGVADLFPSWAPIVRPQECMFTSAHIPLYRSLGVEVLSVYYSAIPFNGFGSFISPLPLERRYNPMKLLDKASGSSMRLMPGCNHADIVEQWASLRRWLVSMRREQAAIAGCTDGSAARPPDLLLIIDMDADDTFWTGFLPAAFKGIVPSACGFKSLVQSVASLPWLRFTRPWDYLSTHEDLGELELGQDLADGAWDGYSSWAEKSENAALWTIVARARRLDELSARLETEASHDADRRVESTQAMADQALSERLLAMSTTHFGMASPVMNADRLKDGFHRANAALEAAGHRLSVARDNRSAGARWYLDTEIDSLPSGTGTIATLRGDTAIPDLAETFTQDAAGVQEVRAVINPGSSRMEKLQTSTLPGVPNKSEEILLVTQTGFSDGRLELKALPGGGVQLFNLGKPVFASPLSAPWIDYGGRVAQSRATVAPRVTELLAGRVAELRLEGAIDLPGGKTAAWTHVYTMAAGIGSITVDINISYPQTPRRGFDQNKAARLARDWDARWRTVSPFELQPAFDATEDSPARIWKHGFFDLVDSYELAYHRFGPNREQDSLDNHVTDGWVAVSAGGQGILVAQSAAAATVFAFCPMRTRLRNGRQSVYLNPFGTYYGRQWKYPLAVTGLGRLAALLGADNLDSYAPSWEGSSIRFSLMLAPYKGDCPPAGLQRDALVFATPPELL